MVDAGLNTWDFAQRGTGSESARGTQLTQCFPAVPESVPEARRALAAFATEAGAYGEQLDNIRLAASEAFANVVQHAYGNHSGRMYLTAAVAADELYVLVGDDGGGVRPGSEKMGLGVGLGLIAHASDELTILKRGSGGTELRMRFAL